MTTEPGVFVISLDFELHWGVFDHLTVDAYRENLLGAREAIPAMLALFEQFGVHVTWATVGLLFFDKRSELVDGVPDAKPTYEDARLSPYRLLPSLGSDETADPFHFGRSLLTRIRSVPHQEIATHTFGHYYCLERGQTIEQFRADLRAARAAAETLGLSLTSIVFPRNQMAPAYLDACAEVGIRVYRGNEQSWPYRPTASDDTSLLRRAVRLIDSYVNLTGHHAVPRARGSDRGMINVPASRFLRPYNQRLRRLEGLKLRRITRAMSYAADHGLTYHLWWHPHNFGQQLAENLEVLGAILEHFSRLASRCGMRSLTMAEVARDVIA